MWKSFLKRFIVVACMFIMLPLSHMQVSYVKANTENSNSEMVILGGRPIGIVVGHGGLTVLGMRGVISANGIKNPAINCNIKAGDIIIEADGKRLTKVEHLLEVLSQIKCEGNVIRFKIKRENNIYETSIVPEKDTNGEFKIGLWLKDDTVGIGTMTFIKKDGNFAALGHPICDISNSNDESDVEGSIFCCRINGVVKGEKGKAGELKGAFMGTNSKIGVVNKNTKFGIFGKMTNIENVDKTNMIELGSKSSVKVGRAKIYTTINGDRPKEYDIQIAKCKNKSHIGDKSMVIKITDRRLIEATGGILQGMSGSPIVQGGKLVGAVTHVFVSDPMRGFGLYADLMNNFN